MIEVDHVTRSFGGAGADAALTDVTFTLERASLTFLTGHSGAGKSTLLRLVLGLDAPTRGTVRVDGQDLAALDSDGRARHRQRIGAVFQDPMLLDDRSVFENVELPLVLAGYRAEDRARRVRAALGRVDLAHRERAGVLQLSAGERQRVGIARAVVNRPMMLLADEPTGNLDPELSEEIMRLFSLFQQAGATVLIATHDLELLDRFDARVLQLAGGKLVRDGDTAGFVPGEAGA